MPAKTDLSIRHELEEEYDSAGGEEMLRRLAAFDSQAADKLNPADRRRIIRAFEIYKTSGMTKSKQNEQSKSDPPPFNPVMIGLNFTDRDLLYDRINRRVDEMIRKGLIDEARAAFDTNIKKGAAQAIGHKEFFAHFRGEQTLKEATEALKQSTRRYAKRQLTWFNKDSRINWIYVDKTEDVFDAALKIIKEEETKNA